MKLNDVGVLETYITDMVTKEDTHIMLAQVGDFIHVTAGNDEWPCISVEVYNGDLRVLVYHSDNQAEDPEIHVVKRVVK